MHGWISFLVLAAMAAPRFNGGGELVDGRGRPLPTKPTAAIIRSAGVSSSPSSNLATGIWCTGQGPGSVVYSFDPPLQLSFAAMDVNQSGDSSGQAELTVDAVGAPPLVGAVSGRQVVALHERLVRSATVRFPRAGCVDRVAFVAADGSVAQLVTGVDAPTLASMEASEAAVAAAFSRKDADALGKLCHFPVSWSFAQNEGASHSKRLGVVTRTAIEVGDLKALLARSERSVSGTISLRPFRANDFSATWHVVAPELGQCMRTVRLDFHRYGERFLLTEVHQTVDCDG